MALILDIIYNNSQQNADPRQANRNHCHDLLSESFRQQTSHPYYAALGFHGMFQLSSTIRGRIKGKHKPCRRISIQYC